MSNKPSSEQVLRAAFDNLIKGVWTAIPCVVVSIESLDQQQINIKPLINQLTRDGNIVERPTIFSVPIVFPSSKSSAFTFPVVVGDIVLAVFSMRGLEAFKTSNGTPTAPLDFSKNDIKDAIAIPGLFPWSLANNDPSKRKLAHSTADAVVAHNIGTDNECEVRLQSDGGIKIKTPGGLVVEADGDVDITCSNANIHADKVNLGDGGEPIARLGDEVTVNVVGGSSNGSHTGTITGASPNNTST